MSRASSNRHSVAHLVSLVNSPYLTLLNEFAGVKAVDPNVRRGFEALCLIYQVTAENINVTEEIAKYEYKMREVRSRYPLLGELSHYYNTCNAIADYVNAIDMMKK
jgi:hypothetical protein